MTKLEKALYFHDYLIRNTAYSDQNTTYCTSEWGVLLKGKGNCQGYAKAYALLLQKVHIPVKFAKFLFNDAYVECSTITGKMVPC